MNGGDRIAAVLKAHGVPFLFTLCGGHISPILVACKRSGIRVIDVRHEVTAVFAADAVARLSGIPGVAAVTAGPGVTNTITALQNAQMAQSPLLLLGGATATALKGRGALQDIDQMAIIKPIVKWATSVQKVRDLIPAVENAFRIAREGVPGPVFLEIPVDLLYDEPLVREWYGVKTTEGKTFTDKAVKYYLDRHVNKIFSGATEVQTEVIPVNVEMPEPLDARIRHTASRLKKARRPVLLLGSQVMLEVHQVNKIAAAVGKMGIPVYLSGMARGLLGKTHRLLLRHQRRKALREADLVILAGLPMDFRLDYGNHIRSSATLISINRSRRDLSKNRRPELGVLGDAGRFLRKLSEVLVEADQWNDWLLTLRERDISREQAIRAMGEEKTKLLNPLKLCEAIESEAGENRIFIADGGDFVATASYIVSTRGPLRWLDPGVYGTLGVGAGFALGAKLIHPDAEVWILYGDGSAGFSLAEYDTFVRHGISVISVVGNDAAWTQIAREQKEILKDDVGTVLRHSDYHLVAEGFGGKGFLLKSQRSIAKTLRDARAAAAEGFPVLINAHIGKTNFRKGSISM